MLQWKMKTPEIGNFRKYHLIFQDLQQTTEAWLVEGLHQGSDIFEVRGFQ